MPFFIVLALMAIAAVVVVSFVLHFLSPWILLLVIGVLAWVRFRPRRRNR